MASHSPLLITLMIGNILAYLANQVLGVLNVVDTEKAFGFKNIFPKTISETSDINFIEITPSSPTFSIWGAIYIWQAVWMIYALVNTCRRAPDGPVYTSPTLLTPTFFAVSIFNWLTVIGWYFTWTHDQLWLAFATLASTFITNYICIGLSYKALAENTDILIQQDRKMEIWMIRAFVHNGLAIYGTWCTIATLLNFAIALSYDKGSCLDQSTSSTIALSILAVELVVFVGTDWTVLDKYSRYTITPYIVVIVALSGSITKNWNPEKTNSIISAVLLGAATLCLAIKVFLMLFRHCRDSKRQQGMTLLTLEEKKDTNM